SNDAVTTALYTLSLHDALPICVHEERAVPFPLLAAAGDGGADPCLGVPALGHDGQGGSLPAGAPVAGAGRHGHVGMARRYGRSRDRKSTRLNSSHVKISYAVFC